jgi:glucose-1-phosphatase
MSGIKNIIFDFGGVIYNIDLNRARKAFLKIGIKDFEQLHKRTSQNDIFEKFETDLISVKEFKDIFSVMTKMNVSDNEMMDAWNSILVGFDENRLKLLEGLKRNYKIFLLSNTNRIHYDFFLKQFQNLTKYKSFDGLFVKSFFSFDIRKRKPDKDAYQHVISNMNLVPEETLFIDDSLQNIEPAKNLGIKAWHLQGELMNLFEEDHLKQEVLNQLD